MSKSILFLTLLSIVKAVFYGDLSHITIPEPQGPPKVFDFSTFVKSHHNNRRLLVDDIDNLDCEVGLLGCGSSSIFLQMFLMDKNYTTCCIDHGLDIAPQINTESTPDGPVDIGVTLGRNISRLEELGFGHFRLNYAAFIEQYAPYGIYGFPPFGSNPSYDVDLKNKIGPNYIAPANSTEQAYLLSCQLLINAKWPFIENAEAPDVIPAPMYVPFLDFLDANDTQLDSWNVSTELHQCFLHFNRTYMLSATSGNMLPARKIALFYMLKQLLPSTSTASEVAGTLFIPIGGFRGVFDTMKARLLNTSHQSLYLNSTIDKVERSSKKGPIKITITTPTGGKVLNVGKLIVTLPQNKDNTEFMDWRKCEKKLIKKIEYFIGYFTTLLKNNGSPLPLIVTKDYYNVKNYFETDTPDFTLIRQVSTNYLAGFASALNDISDADMVTKLLEKLNILKYNLTTSINMTLLPLSNGQYINRHAGYCPYFKSKVLKKSTPYKDIRDFDGFLNTWLAGSLRWYADGSWIADGSYSLVEDQF